MQPLPYDFLTQLAREYELSLEQEEAFVQWFSSGKNQQDVAESLHISHNAFRTRLTGVYRKFSFGKKEPNKSRKLHDLLLSKYQNSNPSPIPEVLKDDIEINALVQEVREKVKPCIQNLCGKMRVLDMSQPIGLNDIYTKVNILEKITGQQRKEIAEFQQECNSENFERIGLGRSTEERVPGLAAVERYTKLILLGKPGAGKTTFLKYVAIQCIGGNFQAEHVPIFVTLKDFAEAANKPGLLEYISQQFSDCGVAVAQSLAPLQALLCCGKALILLDGLDEVREEDNSRVLKEIREFSDHFRDNHFVMTCRIAAREYTFERFTEVEVADFDDEQVFTFATNWFNDKAVKAESFIKRLEENNRIKQLAANPLLLTLLCMAFEESGDFPANRSELYKEGLDVLLKRWDAKRGIERNQVYKKLSLQRKEELISKIALTTFKNGDYFFKQKAAEEYITNYIRHLPNANTNLEALQVDSEAVLRSIEAQHGLLVARATRIYSFSHLTFHEYFTAREIVFGTQPLEEVLRNLVSHITEKRWREVFLLAVGMSPSADRLLQLMKQQVDALVATDEKLQQFLMWVTEKSLSIKIPDNVPELEYNLAAIRDSYVSCALARIPTRELTVAWNLTHDLVRDLDRALVQALDDYGAPSLAREHNVARDCNLTYEFALSRARDFDLARDLTLSRAHDFDLAREFVNNLTRAQYLVCNLSLAPELQHSLQRLRDQIPNPNQDREGFDHWWHANGQAWTQELRSVMIKYRNIGRDWQFNEHQMELLKHYYYANWLLVDCLNSDCYVSLGVRKEIENTWLLPVAEIEKRNTGK